ncbi:MAG TPA: XTP/dITP diphosphatase [archaeon]|nr:XTP/dITP diphosphatase [archaeon]
MKKDRSVFFATSNINKFEEVKLILNEYGITVTMVNAKTLEIQADDLEEIARAAVMYAVRAQKTPIIVEDAGLFVKSLNNFPGPYSSFVMRTIGNNGVLRLMDGFDDRRAEFRSTVAFCTPDVKPLSFNGVVEGNISFEARGKNGFGFDPIFVPTEGSGQTFAEIDTVEKNKISHRARSIRKFAEYFTEQFG